MTLPWIVCGVGLGVAAAIATRVHTEPLPRNRDLLAGIGFAALSVSLIAMVAANWRG